MSGLFRRFLVVCVFLVAVKPTVAQSSHVVVLKNGSVFQGQISKLEHRVQIKLKKGGQVTIPADRVDFVSASLVSAYEFRASRVAQHDIEGRINLARWCLDQQLVNSAADQLLIAQRIAPQSPIVRAFEHEIVASLRNSKTKRTVKARPVSDVRNVTTAPVSEETLATFTTTIQPLLWNRCGASSCHGQRGSSGFRLTVPTRGTVPGRSMTHRNLHATLRQLSAGNAENSPLLMSARIPHGDVNRKVSGLDLEQYEQLLKWCVQAVKSLPSENVAKSTTNANVHLASFQERFEAATKADPFDPAIFNAQQGHNNARQSPSNSDRPWWEVDADE